MTNFRVTLTEELEVSIYAINPRMAAMKAIEQEQPEELRHFVIVTNGTQEVFFKTEVLIKYMGFFEKLN
jgi:uncharacterized protein (DUF2342 family)